MTDNRKYVKRGQTLITDAQLIELLGLDGYLGIDLPDWMITDLGVLVAKGDVTVDEFTPGATVRT